MFSLTLKRLGVLAALATLPMACAPGATGVTPQGAADRSISSGGTTSGGGGGTTTCKPLPGTCVLNATIAEPIRFGGITGHIRFERSPARVAVTGTMAPGGFGPNSYFAILIDTPAGTLAPVGYAARGVMDPVTRIVSFEVLPGDGLFSHTPNSAPIDPRFKPFQALGGAGWSFISDPTPPSPAVVALFEAVKSGSSVRIGTLGVPGQTCPCPAPGPVVPAVLQYDIPPSSLR